VAGAVGIGGTLESLEAGGGAVGRVGQAGGGGGLRRKRRRVEVVLANVIIGAGQIQIRTDRIGLADPGDPEDLVVRVGVGAGVRNVSTTMRHWV
jgi:hypothetical protein